MVAQPLPAPARRAAARSAGAAVLALLGAGALGACSEATLTVEDTRVVSSEPGGGTSAGANAVGAPGADTGTVPSAPDASGLEESPAMVGAFSIRLPQGWTVWPDAASAGEGATVGGAATYTAVPAAGQDQGAWVSALLAGTTDVVAEREGMLEEQPITLADGREAFHLVHGYSENRAHLYGVVDGDQLHMLRFGLDGSPEAAAVISAAVATATLAVATPAETGTAPVAPVSATAAG